MDKKGNEKMCFLVKKEFFPQKEIILQVFSISVLNYCYKLVRINVLKKFDELTKVSQKL